MGFSLKGSANVDAIMPSNYTTKIVVGYPDDEYHDSGYSMAELGDMLSAGTGKIPARPHLEEGVEENMPWVREEVERYFRSRNKDASHIGEAMIEAVKAYVYSGALTPNAPKTIRKKGFDQPLLEFGPLLESMTYNIVKMGGIQRG